MEFSHSLITDAQNLRVLCLNFRHGNFANELLARLITTTCLGSLEVLHLVSVQIDSVDIEKLIRKIGGTLQELSCKHIFVPTGSWKALLTTISSETPHLDSFALHAIKEEHYS